MEFLANVITLPKGLPTRVSPNPDSEAKIRLPTPHLPKRENLSILGITRPHPGVLSLSQVAYLKPHPGPGENLKTIKYKGAKSHG
jgi:hypothetical protein